MTSRAIVVVLDGLRRGMVGPATTPTLTHLAASGSWFDAHRSVFPSATRCVSASFATGCYPARHGLQGNAVRPGVRAERRHAAGELRDRAPTILRHLDLSADRCDGHPLQSERLP